MGFSAKPPPLRRRKLSQNGPRTSSEFRNPAPTPVPTVGVPHLPRFVHALIAALLGLIKQCRGQPCASAAQPQTNGLEHASDHTSGPRPSPSVTSYGLAILSHARWLVPQQHQKRLMPAARVSNDPRYHERRQETRNGGWHWLSHRNDCLRSSLRPQRQNHSAVAQVRIGRGLSDISRKLFL